MIWTMDKALRHKLITVESMDRVAGIIEFRLGIISTVITARMTRDLPNIF